MSYFPLEADSPYLFSFYLPHNYQIRMKIISLSLLIAFYLFASPDSNAQSFRIRKEYKSDCAGGNKTLLTTEEYNQKGLLVKSTRTDRKRSTQYFYDANDNLILKIHTDSAGMITKFNRLSYVDNKLSTDTLFNADSTVNMIFSSRFLAKKREQKIFWIDPKKNTYISTQTIKSDSLGNEIENKNCSSNSDCRFSTYEYVNGKKSAMHYFGMDEMIRKRIPIQSELYEYNSAGQLVKTTVNDDQNNSCQFILTYEYN